MDLKKELLAVLSNPSSLWDSLVENLSNEPRVCLFVLATFPTPVDIIDWQQGVAKVSPEAAVKFEAAIRVLDDSFAHINRDPSGKTLVAFRNPSVEEFVAAQQDRNAGFLITVAANEPSLAQVARLVQLGTASRSGRRGDFSYPHAHAAVVENPTVLVDRLFALLPEASEPSRARNETMLALMYFLGEGRLSRLTQASTVKERLTSLLLGISFDEDAGLLFKLLDDHRHANTVAITLGDRLDQFHEGLVESADSLSHFDSLMNFDQALDRSPENANWASKFEDLSDQWLEESDAESVQSDRDFYERIAEYLDLDAQAALDAWADAVQAAEDSARDAEEPDDDSWMEAERNRSARAAPRSGDSRSGVIASLARASAERGRIDALFESLPDSKSRD